MSKATKSFIFFCLFFVFIALRGFAADLGPIDIVYTWVDGQDPEWQRVRDAAIRGDTQMATVDAKVKCRFRNRNELKYSLRSLCKYADFVNHIYIVTFNQTPVWLKPHPKITIIDHEQIFPDKSHLPTFNSQSIEANLHRIPQLSEHYIYFNDDVFLGKRVKATDFFTPDGKMKFLISRAKAPTGPILPTDIAYIASWKNTNAFLNGLYKKETRNKLHHAAFAFSKYYVEQFEKIFPSIFRKISSHKFRSPGDFTITNGLLQYTALYMNQAKEGSIRSYTVYFGDNLKSNRRQLLILKSAPAHIFCIEDSAVDDSIGSDQMLFDFLESKFPKKAPWEL